MKKYTYIKYRISNVIAISKIVTIHFLDNVANLKTQSEQHDFWELGYIDSGKVTVTAGEREFEAAAGEIWFHHPNQKHGIEIKEGAATIFILSFVSSSLSMRIFKRKRQKLNAEQKKLLAKIIKEAQNAFVLKNEELLLENLEADPDSPIGAQQLIRIYLEELFISLLRVEVSSKKEAPTVFLLKDQMDDHIVNEIIKIINDNISENFSVSSLCAHINYSKTYVSKIFKDSTGSSMIEYYNKAKISRAKQLIHEKKHTFSQVSDILGFSSIHYFSRMFKRITGKTPSEYVNSLENLQD